MERTAHKVRGYILTVGNRTVFREYTSVDRKEYVDYEIRHKDLEVEIIDTCASFYEGFIDYSSRIFEEPVTKGEN